ncbi:dnaG [Wigglesworthia glossinidia endosymbiont of Glossina brevipalpis]|uniref:DNA primase n=1 Tax=Wigglesworthia glossinidia brevipalpis TaxID=36870 RepID=Q8D285_WIGBR|nr:dnaG [Wigglesworthia glossinidia endosymbiont of Glossina brevipalpis]
MNAYISNLFINRLLENINIIELISSIINLKKSGKNYFALCPFHQEKTPSFSVSYEKQFFHCFGCGIHGNAIDFLMNYNNLTFIESIEELSNIAGFAFKKAQSKKIINNEELKKRSDIYKLMNQVSMIYKKILNSKIFIEANDYLNNRGLNIDSIEEFSIGFSSININILNYLKQSLQNFYLLKSSGIFLINEKKKLSNIFKNRIMIPMKDKYGNVIAFGGRSINNFFPKYLNSKETLIFKKSNYLYGIYEIKKRKIKILKILLVEGYFDVISLSQYGIYYSVASLGCTTPFQIKIIFRLTNKIICCYDGDSAGRRSAWKTLINSLSYLEDGREIFFIFLPNNEDPDSLIRKIGKKSFEILIEDAKPMSSFLFDTLIKKSNLYHLDGKVKFIKLILPIIKKIPGKNLRLYIRKEIGYKIGILEDYQLEKFLSLKEIKYKKNKQIKYKNNIMNTLIGLLIQNPKLSKLISKKNEIKLYNIRIKEIPFFIELIKICKNNTNINTSQILEHYRGKKYHNHLENLAIWDHMISENLIKQIFIETLSSLYKIILVSRQNILISRARIQDLSVEEKKELWCINKKLSKK